ncbi:unnamed protein product [Mytilus edulis]|uniref:Uncharacterized protein n=1 Tax=Mytilus edulis TaxID=6550 RepID=A0A8S3QA59_MYTED|nr:unnamed protein product [Mytilus edulis]
MQGANQSTNDDDINVSTSNDDTLDNATFQDLVRPKTFNSSLKSAAVACRELTCLIINCTHLCQNIDALDHLSNMLDEARAYISSNIIPMEILPLKEKKTANSVQRQNQNEYNQTIVIDGHASLPSEVSTSIQPPSAERTLDASHPPKHVEFRDPICTVMGEEDIVTSDECILSIKTKEIRYQVNIEDYDILLRHYVENNNHWCLMVIYPQSRAFVFESFRREQDTTGPIFTELVVCSVYHFVHFRRIFCLQNMFLQIMTLCLTPSKRAIRASRHIIGQVLVDNSATERLCPQDPQQQKLKAMKLRTQQISNSGYAPKNTTANPRDMPQSTQQQQPKDIPQYTTAATQGYSPIKEQQQPNDMPPRSQTATQCIAQDLNSGNRN